MGYIAYQPRLMVANSLTHSSKSYNLQLMIVNDADKHNYEIMKLRRSTVVMLAGPEIGPSKNNLSPEIASVADTKGSQSDQEDIQLTGTAGVSGHGFKAS